MNRNQLLSALLIGSGLLWQSCGGSKDNKPKGGAPGQQAEMAMPVSTAIVGKEIVSGLKSYPASVVPLQETEIRAEVTGYITNIFVADGAFVSKGQRLYEIDRVRYQAAVDQAKASLEIAKANLDRVQKDLQRYQTLAEKDAIAKQTLDYATTDVNNQRAQVQAAEAALTTARTNLQRSTIVAPFSGNIGISQVRNGALVNAGTTLLNTVSSTNPIAVEFQINEKEIPEFTKLQAGNASTQIYASMPDGSRYEESGRIVTIDRAVDSQTGTLKVRASFANSANALRAGMNTTLNVESTSTQEEMVIPYKAVFEQLGVFNVYTVNDSSKVELKQIVLGHKLADKVVVTSGLETGQKIVVDGAASLRPGAKVAENNAENKQK
ncbi:efflux RND transporter periplasmic adaptor subunit [Sphingobacterium yanglingense]|uniref:Membrane fusion protein (Multidrug efflux system) n=1 Tax=Sphingobacterium yanglingense TaxID=1437280 RepID=A0A4R6WHX7_9SPHI|nr:efflux RND transporter periplasmic adaptor subunit [Sphingobacterium yanglingense]TDQ78007.1 membrane fusion protein (multidrug efflux system) [Sphingobacterium yanglingense]